MLCGSLTVHVTVCAYVCVCVDYFQFFVALSLIFSVLLATGVFAILAKNDVSAIIVLYGIESHSL